MKKIILMLALLTANLSATFAHEMWLETKPNGKVGTAHEVKVFFGEFTWGTPTKAAKWYSDIADCKLTLVSPDGNVEVLNKKMGEDFYSAVFTPTVPGVYKIGFSHEVRDIYKEMKLTYNSAAVVNVEAGNKGNSVIGNGFYQLEVKNSDIAKKWPSKFVLLKEGAAIGAEQLEVNNTDSLTQNVTTAKDGSFSLPKGAKGKQLIMLSHGEKVEGKTHNGTPYTNDYSVFTFFTEAE